MKFFPQILYTFHVAGNCVHVKSNYYSTSEAMFASKLHSRTNQMSSPLLRRRVVLPRHITAAPLPIIWSFYIKADTEINCHHNMQLLSFLLLLLLLLLILGHVIPSASSCKPDTSGHCHISAQLGSARFGYACL